jgi:glycosyltransferase involved in cell wall biosynthesis
MGVTKGLLESLESHHGLVHPVFLYVGRLVRAKGLRELLHGWEIYVNSFTSNPGSLLIVGDGSERRVLEDMVSEKGMPGVVFAGQVDYGLIARYYAVSDVFVMPTLEDNWSLAVSEAMACGKPVLCSCYNGGWPELVQQGTNGWVFDPRNLFEIMELLRVCRKQSGRLKIMGESSQTIVKRYSPRRAAEAVLEACLMALSHKNSRRGKDGLDLIPSSDL